jgi:hypothetical protein
MNWSENACDDPAKAIMIGREDKPKLNWCIGSSAGDDTMVENLNVVKAVVKMSSDGGWSVAIRLWDSSWSEIGDEEIYFPQEMHMFDDQYYILARKSLPNCTCDYGHNSHILIPVALIASILFT